MPLTIEIPEIHTLNMQISAATVIIDLGIYMGGTVSKCYCSALREMVHLHSNKQLCGSAG